MKEDLSLLVKRIHGAHVYTDSNGVHVELPIRLVPGSFVVSGSGPDFDEAFRVALARRAEEERKHGGE